jgi:hypothetical protein
MVYNAQKYVKQSRGRSHPKWPGIEETRNCTEYTAT